MQYKSWPNKKGIALFVVMITAAVLALMMTAFFQAYRSHFALSRASNASQRAGAGCDSIYQYAVYRLEHDKTWGSTKFTDSGLGDPSGETLDLNETVGTNDFSGSIERLDATFEGEIYNNLSGTAEPYIAALAQPGTVFCRVTTHSGEATRRAEFVLRIAPLFDSSVLSRAKVDVDAEKLYMRSRDENRNMLRAQGDIYVPDVLTAADSQFLQPDSTDADNNGMLWSQGDIYSYLGVGGPAEAIDEADELADAVANSNGKIVAGADSDFEIYPLTADNLQLPEDNQLVPLADGADSMAGRWNFVKRKATVEFDLVYTLGLTEVRVPKTEEVWIDVLEWYPENDGVVADIPERIYRADTRHDGLVDDTTPGSVTIGGKGKSKGKSASLSGPDVGDFSVHMYADMGVDEYVGDEVVFLSDDETANFTFNLLDQKVTATSNATVTIGGGFQVTSETDPNATLEGIADTPPPELDLGYDETDTNARAALVADGTLNIENGVTTGLGALVAKDGDVRIQPKNTDIVDVDAGDGSSGLLIFAGGDVVLSNPDESEKWDFKGLVYAEDGIQMDGHGQDATFEGTIVSRQMTDPEVGEPDGIQFVECGEIEFIYNSELLDNYVKNLPGQRIQLETVYWKR
jgi:hypothetical protein